MIFKDLKSKFISMFDENKLIDKSEWGFFNEQNKDIKKIAYATNMTLENIKNAHELGADILVTHHITPLLIYGLRDECYKLIKEYNLIHLFCHLPLDDAYFGTGATLADALGMKKDNRKRVVPHKENYFCGLIGELENPLTIDEFKNTLSTILNEAVKVCQNNDKLISKICVTTGGCHTPEDIKQAVDNGCDTYITGEYVLSSGLYSKLSKINFISGSHTFTEVLGVEHLCEKLAKSTDMEIMKVLEENY